MCDGDENPPIKKRQTSPKSYKTILREVKTTLNDLNPNLLEDNSFAMLGVVSQIEEWFSPVSGGWQCFGVICTAFCE